MGVSAAVMAVAAAGATMYSSHQQRMAQEDSINAQKESAAEAQANRPQPSKAPNVQAVQASQAGAGQGGGAPGVAQTFLTGASGVDPSLLNLGKNTLLGGG
jgi:uncharacterized protein HemX